MHTIAINSSKKYHVTIDRGLLARCGQVTSGLMNPCETVIVSDDHVYPLYGEKVKQSFEDCGFVTKPFVFPSGEHSKNMEMLGRLLEFMAEEKLTRSGLVIALGGGVTGDLAGFAASVYLRGIPYIQIPTTFLSAIDSSVGGKTGVNLGAGKNLAGSFYQPTAVLCDPDVFATLPREVFADGICEAVKYGCIADQQLFDTLLREDLDENLESIIKTCVEIKRDIVQKDEFDTGERQLLNFGHTAGHAIEALSGYRISHGHAVAIGMHIMVGSDLQMALSGMFQKHQIDIRCPYDAKSLAQQALSDKKRKGSSITVILLETIGKGYLKQIKTDGLEDYFARGLTSSWTSG